MHFSHTTLLILLLSLSHQAIPNSTQNSVLEQLNTIRQQARMSPLTYSQPLSRASQNHAEYLSHHVVSQALHINLHKEKSSLSGFTGVNSSDRAKQIGYLSTFVKENISSGNQDSEDSIEGLMSGIYHRFTFLDFLIDTVGYGVSGNSSGYKTYVYNMGRKDIENVCKQRPEKVKPQKPFDCLGVTVNADYMNKLCENLPKQAVYEAPYSIRCPNGKLLKARYINDQCRRPPSEMLFSGHGSYFEMCEPSVRVNAKWLENSCDSNNPAIIHNGDTRYYTLCNNNIKVYSKWLKARCQTATSADKNLQKSSYTSACHSGFNINSHYLESLDKRYFSRSPDFVIWPPAGARHVSPVFFEEEPDPLPDLEVSGYPLSLHFNPGKVKSVMVKNFTLEKVINAKKHQRISHIRELNHATDPQKKFTTLQFAWYPLQRLDWDSYYRASVTAIVDGRQQDISWGFKTKPVTTDLFVLTPSQDVINVPLNQWFTLYIAPNKHREKPFKKIRFKWQGATKVESEIVDTNTLKVRINEAGCSIVSLVTFYNRVLKLNTCSH